MRRLRTVAVVVAVTEGVSRVAAETSVDGINWVSCGIAASAEAAIVVDGGRRARFVRVHAFGAPSLRVGVAACPDIALRGGEVCSGHGGVADVAITYLVPPKESVSYAGRDWDNVLRSLASLAQLDDNGRAAVRLFLDVADTFSQQDVEDLLAAASPRAACVVRVQLRRFSPGSIR